ncbi:SdiA-regulated domain-containing protein [Lutibacter sp. TH_r2]|uniref:SdiA-regulated domain-containing protein n=1 Tax=Lutibacter sp. TH_r2 TaxID=3082083 RepID=UPI002953B51C|nr:SdiA-regulated domain-containing protein [Lutibacter sp. TH_r2]MDV7186853.1 SdiA-regulated domain-containing protein [Lutibacter sp. TH_r2]
MRRIVFLFILSIFFSSCFFNSTSQNILQPTKVVKLNIVEPSGITFYNNHLYIVSDSNSAVYKTSLQGSILKKIKVSTTDNEGVCFNTAGDLVLVNESKRRLIKIDSSFKKEKKYRVKGKQKHKNSGLEGVCFVPLEECYFIVNEKSPKQLLKVSKKGKVTKEIRIDFADDLSGICFDKESNTLWIVSDESRTILNVSLKGKLLKSYPMSIVKAEGITIVGNQIFVVSDEENSLYIFKKPN